MRYRVPDVFSEALNVDILRRQNGVTEKVVTRISSHALIDGWDQEALYGFQVNPMRRTGKMGSKKSSVEMKFWTREEYLHSRSQVMDKPISFLAFEVLYWTGIPKGERIFRLSKSFLYHEMWRSCALAGTKVIRIHDLRHSHVSLLIELGYSVPAIVVAHQLSTMMRLSSVYFSSPQVRLRKSPVMAGTRAEPMTDITMPTAMPGWPMVCETEIRNETT